MEIREANVGDVAALQSLYEELMPEVPVNVLPERIEDIRNDEGNFLFVCELDGQVVGTASLTICKIATLGFQPFAIIENVVVTEKCRGKGIGKALLLFVEKNCKELNCAKIVFLSRVHRTDAHRFYERMGYSSELSKGFKKYINR